MSEEEKDKSEEWERLPYRHARYTNSRGDLSNKSEKKDR